MRIKLATLVCLVATVSLVYAESDNRDAFHWSSSLKKGINIDTAGPGKGVWPKIQHDAAHFEAAADAGFGSVRVFLPVRAN